MKDDDKVEAFFKGMKEMDEHLVVPPFPKQIKSERKTSFLYAAAAVAAVLVIVIFLIYPDREHHVLSEETLILVSEDDLNTNSLMEEKSLADWESPTHFLSEDF